MTKEWLEQIPDLKNEIRLLQREIDNPVIATDKVTGSMAEFPYIKQTILIKGVDVQQDDRLQRKLLRKLADLQDLLADMEGWLDQVEDSEMRQILRLRYRNELTWQQIALELNYADESVVRKRHNRFLQMTDKSER